MKRIQIISLLAASFMLFGCKTETYVTPANAKTSAFVACSGVLNLAVQPADRPVVSAYIYSVAHGIRSLAGGTVPTPEELKMTVALFTKNAQVGQWASLGTGLQLIYSGIYGHLNGDSKLAAEYLENIAAGAEEAAKPFLTSTPTPAP